MKKLIIICCCVFSAVAGSAQTDVPKHALLIGIGAYPASSNWMELNSVNDVALVKTTLIGQGFPESNITTVINGQATRPGIVAAMKDLIQRVQENKKQVVYIHVSSHGVQLEDDNGDEPDNLDEAIVPINAIYNTDPGIFKSLSQLYLRDDEFGDLIEQLRTKIGKEGDVVVFMDCCHSGTATRGEQVVTRGNKPPLTSGNTAMKPALDSLKGFREQKASRGDDGNKATYVVFSAARSNEAAYETDNGAGSKMGALSYAFCNSINKVTDQTMTYRGFFSEVEAIMEMKSNIQHPVIEGNGMDRGFWGGAFIKQEPYVKVELINNTEKTARIAAGSFSGVLEGSEISFYPNNTQEISKAKAYTKGVVTKASQFSAEVKLQQPLDRQPQLVWAFVTKPAFKIAPITVKIDDDPVRAASRKAFTKEEAGKIKSRLSSMPQYKTDTKKPDLVLLKGTDGIDTIMLANGFVFDTTTQANLANDLARYSKYKYLKELDIRDPSIKVEVILNKQGAAPENKSSENKAVKGYEFFAGDRMTVTVKNKGSQVVYVNILDFQPDGIVNAMFPNSNPQAGRPITKEDLLVPANSERSFDQYIITIGPPYGREVLKVFVSTAMIDMENVANDMKKRNAMSALEALVYDVPRAATRGTGTINMEEAKGAVFNLPFDIKKR